MGLLGSIGKLVGGAVKRLKGVAISAVPGGSLVAGAVGLGSKIAGRIGRTHMKQIAAGGLLAGGLAAGSMLGGRAQSAADAAAMAGGDYRPFRRRINPGNVRAMRRAIRRVESGAKLYSKMFGITHHKSIKGTHVHVKRHRRAA